MKTTWSAPLDVFLSTLGEHQIAVDATRVARIGTSARQALPPGLASIDLAEHWRLDETVRTSAERRCLHVITFCAGEQDPSAISLLAGETLLFASLEPDTAVPLPSFFTPLGHHLGIGGLIHRSGESPVFLLDVDRLRTEAEACRQFELPEEPTRA